MSPLSRRKTSFSAATSSQSASAPGGLSSPHRAQRGEGQPELPLARLAALWAAHGRFSHRVGAGDPLLGLLLPLYTPGHGGGAAAPCASPSPSGTPGHPHVPRPPVPTRNYWCGKALCVRHKSPTGLLRSLCFKIYFELLLFIYLFLLFYFNASFLKAECLIFYSKAPSSLCFPSFHLNIYIYIYFKEEIKKTNCLFSPWQRNKSCRGRGRCGARASPAGERRPEATGTEATGPATPGTTGPSTVADPRVLPSRSSRGQAVKYRPVDGR